MKQKLDEIRTLAIKLHEAKMNSESYLSVSRADSIPSGESGLWSVRKFGLPKPLLAPRPGGKSELIPPGSYTSLMRLTESTMHLIGELVMHDVPAELRKHLIFMMRAKGNVLITGLGLGCVTRGVLANPAVDRVTVVESSPDVLKLVGPYMPHSERLRIVKADAVEFAKATDETFDCAWHDLWTNTEAGEKHLVLVHSELIAELITKVKSFQGAWEFPRWARKQWAKLGVI